MLQIINDIFGLNYFILYIYAHNFAVTISYFSVRSLTENVDVQIFAFVIHSVYI